MKNLKFSALLSIAAEAIYTVVPFLASVIATATVPLIKRQVYTLPSTTCRCELALHPTSPTVVKVCHQVYAFVLTTNWPRASCRPADLWVLMAIIGSGVLLGEEATNPAKRRLQVSRRGCMVLKEGYVFSFFILERSTDG